MNTLQLYVVLSCIDYFLWLPPSYEIPRFLAFFVKNPPKPTTFFLDTLRVFTIKCIFNSTRALLPYFRCLIGSELDHRSLPLEFESPRAHT